MSKRAIYMGGKRTVVAAGGGGGGTFGPEVASDDWTVDEGTLSGPSLVATPSAADIGVDEAGMDGWRAYAMMWDLDDIEADATISSATLKVTTTATGGNTSAEWHLGTEAGIDTSAPTGDTAAMNAVDRCSSGWSDTGVSPANDTQYSIDVKDEIEAIIGRGSWAAGGTITLFLAGPVTGGGSPWCTGDGTETSTVETIAASASADRPSLTVVYS